VVRVAICKPLFINAASAHNDGAGVAPSSSRSSDCEDDNQIHPTQLPGDSNMGDESPHAADGYSDNPSSEQEGTGDDCGSSAHGGAADETAPEEEHLYWNSDPRGLEHAAEKVQLFCESNDDMGCVCCVCGERVVNAKSTTANTLMSYLFTKDAAGLPGLLYAEYPKKDKVEIAVSVACCNECA